MSARSIRVQLQRDLDPSDPNYRLLKGSLRMLVAKESGIDSKYDQKALVVKKRIDKLLKASPDLNEAYQALQCLHYINDMTIPALQRAQLTESSEMITMIFKSMFLSFLIFRGILPHI